MFYPSGANQSAPHLAQDITLVDEKDKELGVGEKMDVHRLGTLHRAFSVFVFNSRRELLMQKRATSKYHSGGLWSNTCCGHPQPGENIINAANRRLFEEMGIKCSLQEVFQQTYRAVVDHGLVEHEYDHVFVGTCDSSPIVNQQEASDWKWIDIVQLEHEVARCPEHFTAWFKLLLPKISEYIRGS